MRGLDKFMEESKICQWLFGNLVFRLSEIPLLATCETGCWIWWSTGFPHAYPVYVYSHTHTLWVGGLHDGLLLHDFLNYYSQRIRKQHVRELWKESSKLETLPLQFENGTTQEPFYCLMSNQIEPLIWNQIECSHDGKRFFPPEEVKVLQSTMFSSHGIQGAPFKIKLQQWQHCQGNGKMASVPARKE